MISFFPGQARAMVIQDSKSTEIVALQQKIAKNYSNKFCNAIGIGLSKDSAIKLAIGENKNPRYNPSLWKELAFSGKGKIENIDNDKLVIDITSSISNKCGNAIDIYSQEDLDQFAIYFKSIQSNQ